jgi:uncharacterized protein (DUF1330 family)
MKIRHVVALSLFTGVAIGGAAIQGLHAQAKPPVYFVADNDVSDADAYAKEYLSLAQPLIKAGGGRYLAAGKATSFDGEPPKSRVIIIRWDSMDQLKTWFNSPEYRAARKIGDKYAKFHTFAIEGLPGAQ